MAQQQQQPASNGVDLKKSDSQASAYVDEELESRKQKKKNKNQAEKEKKARERHEKEQKALVVFKERIKDLQKPPGHDDDACYLRFLRARKLDVEKAYTMFDTCLKWRARYHPENIVFERDCPRESQLGKGYPLGRDTQNRPTFLVFTGRHDPKNADNEECVRALVYHVESAIKTMPPGVEQCSIIIDFENWGLKNTDHNLDKMMMDTIQNYYPERLGVAYLLHPPTVFKIAWSVVKPWLDKRTTSKLRFISVNSKDGKEELMQAIGPATLPVRYGGQNSINLDPPKGGAIKGPPKGLAMSK